MDRIMIIGQPGSGKSWLARALGARTGLPVYHMDHIHWTPGWVERAEPEKHRLTCAVHAAPRWIFEGGYSKTWPDRLARCDLVIWLDLPVGLRLWRVTKRLVTGYGKTRPDMAEHCPERLGAQSWPFYRYIWTTRHSARDRIKALLRDTDPRKLRHLTSRAAVQSFVNSFDALSCTTIDTP